MANYIKAKTSDGEKLLLTIEEYESAAHRYEKHGWSDGDEIDRIFG